jgi:hypothetical protein
MGRELRLDTPLENGLTDGLLGPEHCDRRRQSILEFCRPECRSEFGHVEWASCKAESRGGEAEDVRTSKEPFSHLSSEVGRACTRSPWSQLLQAESGVYICRKV